MDQHETQKDRILQFIEKLGISKNKFYSQTGVANGTLDKKSGITGDTILKIYTAYPQLNLQWLIAGEGTMTKVAMLTEYKDLNIFRRIYATLLNVDIDSLSEENFQNEDFSVEFTPLVAYNGTVRFQGYVSIPKIDSCEGAGFVTTDSMYPLLKPGDLVCYKTSGNTDRIHWGKMYVLFLIIDGEKYRTIKNIEKSELGDNYVRLTGHNNKYQPIDIRLENIEWKALIKAHVNYHSVL